MDSIYFSEIVSLPDVEWVSTFGFSCGGRYLAMRSVKSRDNRLTIYDLDSGDLVKNISIQRFISSIVWHPTDETVLAVGVSPWELIILDIMGSSVCGINHRRSTGTNIRARYTYLLLAHAPSNCVQLQTKRGQSHTNRVQFQIWPFLNRLQGCRDRLFWLFWSREMSTCRSKAKAVSF